MLLDPDEWRLALHPVLEWAEKLVERPMSAVLAKVAEEHRGWP